MSGHRITRILLFSVSIACSATAIGQDEEATPKEKSAPAHKAPAHTPEWTDHNESDPGVTVLEAASGDLSTAGAAEEDTATAVRFGDGQHGRIPSDEKAGGAGTTELRPAAAGETDEAEGDPDQPVITGRVPSERKE